MTSALLDITINIDDNFENNETFDLGINIFSLPPDVTVGDTNQATVTIMNDDGKYIHSCYSCEIQTSKQHYHCEVLIKYRVKGN